MIKLFNVSTMPFVLCAFLITSCALFQPSPTKLNKLATKANKQYDAIIVPGVPFNPSNWDSVMKMRVMWAAHLYKKGVTKKVIMSGSSVYSPYVESKIMKLYAIALGIPEKDILIEERAQHSTENIWYSYKLGKSLGFHCMALATDPFQNRMMYRFVKKRCNDVKYLPVIIDTLKILPNYNPVIDYQPLKIDSFKSIVETQTLRYRVKGTMGKHINFKE